MFLEATLAVLGLGDKDLPTWGKLLNDAYSEGALLTGHFYWVVEPAVLLILTGFGFAMVGFALDRIFNPRLRVVVMNKTLLEVKNLKLYFRTSKGPVQAVDDVSFKLNRGKTLAVVGESGCGKTSLAKAVLRLLPRNIMVYSGEIILDGEDIMQYNEEQFRRDIRWKKIAMVPQAAMNSLNPVLRIVDQIIEPLLIHDRDMIKDKALARVKEMFKIVGLPEDFLYRYPFELSGGMRQRATIAMALATNPELVILDEPSSALDLLTQANLMNVLKRIKHDFGTTFILITHDIGTARAGR